MHPADFSGAPESLLVHENRSEQCPEIGKSKCETLLDACTNGAATHLIQRVAIPPTIHWRVAETEGSGRQDSAEEAPVMHLYIPRARTVDANVRERQKIGQHIL